MFKGKNGKISINGKEFPIECFDISIPYEDDNYEVPEEHFNKICNYLIENHYDKYIG